MTVPDSLRTESRFEPSGIAWLPTSSAMFWQATTPVAQAGTRALAFPDGQNRAPGAETGHRQRHRRLNDVESIAADPKRRLVSGVVAKHQPEGQTNAGRRSCSK
jgi:hypothetical protein